MTQQPLTQDFASLYTQALFSAGVEAPSYDAMRAAVIEGLDGEVLCFTSFQAFFDWWDTLTAYEQADFDESSEDHRALLHVVYQSLVSEGAIQIAPKASQE
ncbi:hypothetical protein R5M92_04205 [Halomonas sp. Bachu 37]|uniref:hypothetical protein n=1 Tax=Halomonas kashgarensis TaxID=3084920 RepID=UPI0032164901